MGQAMADDRSVLDVVMEMRAAGLSYNKVAHRLNARDIPTEVWDGRWGANQVYRLLDKAGEVPTDDGPGLILIDVESVSNTTNAGPARDSPSPSGS